MEKSNFTLILIQDNGSFANPDIEITENFENVYSIQNAADIGERKDNLSKNISFPGTKNNDRIFNSLYSFNRSSDSNLPETLFFNYSPNIGVRAVLLENNFPIIAGELKINDIVRNPETLAFTYTGIITGRLISFFARINNLLLTDLTGYNEVVSYTWANIVSSWDFNPADKFFFPMIDYGNGLTQNVSKFDIKNVRPGLYCTPLIRAILNSQGYTLKSDFLDSDVFNRAFIPFQEVGFGTTTYGNFLLVNGGAYTIGLNLPRRRVVSSFAGSFYGDLPANDFVGVVRNLAIGQSGSGTAYWVGHSDVFSITRPISTEVAIKVDFEVHARRSVGQLIMAVRQVVAGQINLDTPSLVEQVFDFASVADFRQTITLTVDFRAFATGASFALIATVISPDSVDYTQYSVNAKFGNPDASVGSFSPFQLGETFNLKDALPKEQKATDILRSILKTLNMYAIENPDNDRELIIEPYDVFYNQTEQPNLYALNWSKKIDQKTLHIKINTSLPKIYNFKFKEDADYYNTLYKNIYNAIYGNFSIDNKNGSVDAKNIETIFSATVPVREDGDDKTMPAIYVGEINEKKPYKSNLRLLFNNGSEACTAYNIVDTVTPGVDTVKVAGVTIYQKSHHVLTLAGEDVFNLLFGIPLAVYYPVTGAIYNLPTIYSELYQKQLAELNSENIFTLECDAHLNEIDVSELDLRTPIFMATVQGSAYFKIMSVTYYSSREVAKVVLQKIIL